MACERNLCEMKLIINEKKNISYCLLFVASLIADKMFIVLNENLSYYITNTDVIVKVMYSDAPVT